jgi:predicted small lipoprotein YifL
MMPNRSAMRLLLLSLIALGLLGCGQYRPLYQPHDANGDPIAFKRRARHETRDFYHHWRRPVYVKVSEKKKAAKAAARAQNERFSLTQEALVAEVGLPDYVRPPFRSLNHERTVEWLYLQKDILAQFVGGEMVFTGPVTDRERTLIQRGYPDKVVKIREEIGPERVTFVYHNSLATDMEVFSFADDELITSVE